jgi:hypothetical protein
MGVGTVDVREGEISEQQLATSAVDPAAFRARFSVELEHARHGSGFRLRWILHGTDWAGEEERGE